MVTQRGYPSTEATTPTHTNTHTHQHTHTHTHTHTRAHTHARKSTHQTQSQPPLRVLLAIVWQLVPAAVDRPAAEHLVSSPPPYLNGDRSMQMLEHFGSTCCTASSRNSFRKRAKDGQSTGMWSPIRAPDDGHIIDILLLQSSKVGPVIVHLFEVHRFGAVAASQLRIRRGDADIKCHCLRRLSRCQLVASWFQV